ncbi:MAG: prephenate dehydratase [Hadesarchaea archaeon]|nr:prephenate dehydratase [Hadesarchaea archaeon]
MKVGILGPRGTYSEVAARSHFSPDAEFVPYSLITDVAEAVEGGEVSAGVVPVESLREGSVGETLDALAWHDVKVQAEIVIRIFHSLLGTKDAEIEEIKQVLSHPQALNQCQDFIREELPEVEFVTMSSTARAAEQIGKLRRSHMAAVGSKVLADIYDLKVIQENIQTGEDNLTRFFCLSKEDAEPTGNDKTSIVFYTEEDRPGILEEILREFADRNINLTKIESRPSKKALGDYLFFIDLEGHRKDSLVSEALEIIEPKVATLKVIGSYPQVSYNPDQD